VNVLLEAEEIELAYGQVSVCRNISLRLERGEIVALIGANGAGKSTILRAIAGVLPEDFHFAGMGRANIWVPLRSAVGAANPMPGAGRSKRDSGGVRCRR